MISNILKLKELEDEEEALIVKRKTLFELRDSIETGNWKWRDYNLEILRNGQDLKRNRNAQKLNRVRRRPGRPSTKKESDFI